MLTFLLTFVMDPKDEDRFTEIYYTYREPMHNIAESVLHNFHDAEDAVQIAFISISKHVKKLTAMEENAVRAYVCKSAKNAALNLLPGKNKRDQIMPLDEETMGVSDDLIEAYISNDRYERIVSIIQALPEPYRDVLSLYYIYEMKPREIASSLGRKSETVKCQLKRGKAILLNKLKEQFHE